MADSRPVRDLTAWFSVRYVAPKAKPKAAPQLPEPEAPLPAKRLRKSAASSVSERLELLEQRLSQPDPEVVRLKAELERILL